MVPVNVHKRVFSQMLYASWRAIGTSGFLPKADWQPYLRDDYLESALCRIMPTLQNSTAAATRQVNTPRTVQRGETAVWLDNPAK